MINDFAYRLSMQGITLEKYLELTNSNIEDLMKQYRPQAEALVKADLVLEQIAKVENIKATTADVDEEIKKTADKYQQEPEKIT